MEQSRFTDLVASGMPTGEIVAVNRFLVTIEGLENVAVGAYVLFENGNHGIVHQVRPDYAIVLNLSSELLSVGLLAVVQSEYFTIATGEELVGRVVSPIGAPIDGGKAIGVESHQEIFAEPPSFSERDILMEQLETGVMLVDTLFPIVLGQRIAIMGDSKSGKTTFLTQLSINQAKKGRLIVYVMIGKRKYDIELLLARINKSGARNRIILVVADVFDALPMTYLAPYCGCAIAEYFWHKGEDVVIIYDDLSNHAKAYRELSLMLRQNPGRESYPGDMFHAHSSLLERAGKLSSNGKSLTSLPVAVTPNDDITGYLSTSLISITDGQIIFDIETMHQNIVPAVNVGLSVSRVGGRSQTDSFRTLATQVSQKLAAYRSTKELSRFTSEQSEATRIVLLTGERIYDAFRQRPEDLHSLLEQEIILQVVSSSQDIKTLDMVWLKRAVADKVATVSKDIDQKQITSLVKELLTSLEAAHA